VQPEDTLLRGSQQPEHTVCANCGARLAGSYCHVCGQKAELGLLSFRRFVAAAIGDLFHLDSKLLRTLRLLVARPGCLTAAFVEGRRARYVQPLQLYFLAASLFFVVGTYRPIVRFDPETGAVASSLNAVKVGASIPPGHFAELARRGISIDLFAERFRASVNRHLPTFLIGSVLLFSLGMAAFYYRSHRPYLEHLVFALHWSAFYLLLMSVVLLVPRGPTGRDPARILDIVSFLLAWAYLGKALLTVHAQSALLTLVQIRRSLPLVQHRPRRLDRLRHRLGREDQLSRPIVRSRAEQGRPIGEIPGGTGLEVPLAGNYDT
jgi:hypothetical protein